MKSVGKVFENNFKASCPKEWFYYRLFDGTASYDESQATRFQLSNICDCFIFTGSKLLLCELKSFKGTSMPFSNIRETQLTRMLKAEAYENVKPYFILNARRIEKTFFMLPSTLIKIQEESSKKSINIKELESHPAIHELPSKKKKVHFTYDLHILNES